MKKLVSVIVPVYNIENEIERCIKSIMDQTFQDLEIIIVDDGSTDKSLEICQRYAKIDKRIKVIHKKNGGAASARKAGIQVARGEYVAYIDGDDWIETEYIETLVEGTDFEIVDVVIAGFIFENVDGKTNKIPNKLPSGLYDKESMKYAIYPVMMEKIFASNCSKLIRRSLAFEKTMLVEDSIKCDNDTVVTYPILIKAKSIRIIDACQYHYVRRTDSVSTYGTDAATYFFIIEKVYEMLKKEFVCHEEKKELMLNLENLISSRIVAGMSRYYALHIQKYMFPYELVPQRSRVILYGAGTVGRDFFRQIIKNKYCEIVLWIDQNYDAIDIPYAEVKNPKTVLEENYDYIIVCVNSMNIAQDIIQKLNDMGVSDKKIVWKEDYRTDLNVQFGKQIL